MGSRDGSVAARVAILAKHTNTHRMSIKRRYSSAVCTDVPFHPDEAAGEPMGLATKRSSLLRSQLLRTTADAQLGCLYVHTSAQVEHYVGFLPYVPGLLETATRHVHINIRVIFVQLFKASCNCPLQHIKTWLCQSDDHISYPDQAY
jgi:hypothetical protein